MIELTVGLCVKKTLSCYIVYDWIFQRYNTDDSQLNLSMKHENTKIVGL